MAQNQNQFMKIERNSEIKNRSALLGTGSTAGNVVGLGVDVL